VDLGFDPRNVLFSRLPLPAKQYKSVEAKHRFFGQLLRRLQALPGVVAVSSVVAPPPFGGIGSDIDIPGKIHSEKWKAIFELCSEGYFPTLGTKLLRGRTLSEVDVNDGRKVAVINQTLVNRYFGTEDPIGQRIKIALLEKLPDGRVDNPSFEVIGVIRDIKNDGIQDPTSPEMFLPYTVTAAFDRSILVRTAKDPMAIQQAVRREIWAVDRNVALTFTGSLEEFLTRFWYSGPRFALILLGVFAGVGLVLVALGVYSVIAYTVSRQTHEIGIRMALGAGAGDVLRMVLRMGLRLIVFGVAAGLLASILAARLLASQLWGVSPYDPVALGAVVAVVAVSGCAACYFPARRATHVDPLIALRYE
jgi:putative ABC transport system permease protein